MNREECKRVDDYIQEAIAIARGYGTRTLRFLEDGIEIVDAMGNPRRFSSIIPTGPATIRQRGWSWYGGDLRFEHHGISTKRDGAWKIVDSDGDLVIKPNRRLPSCMEAVGELDANSIAALRSLYREGDVDIFLAGNIGSKVREATSAITCELNLTGHLASVRHGSEPLDTQPDYFTADKPEWQVFLLGPKENPAQYPPPEAGISRIFVWESERAAHAYGSSWTDSIAPSRRKTVVGAIVTEKDVTRINLVFSKRAAQACSNTPDTNDTPWARYARLKASRTPQEKTWHGSIEALVDAYIARKAPRGFISDRSLYFHGPVLYSLFDGNPIAAFVETPHGKDILFTGRHPRLHGTMTGTVSGHQNALSNALFKHDIETFHLDNLKDVLTISDLRLETIPWSVGAKKKEDGLPRACRLDIEALSQLFQTNWTRMTEQFEKSMATKFPTYSRAGILRGLHLNALTADRLSTIFGVDFGYVGDADEYARCHDEEIAAADERKQQLRTRARLAAPGP